jgi:hypothetical protein
MLGSLKQQKDVQAREDWGIGMPSGLALLGRRAGVQDRDVLST